MKKTCVIEKRWVISQNRWQLLLSQYGKRTTGYGMCFSEKPQEKREVIEEIYQMLKEKILLPDGDKLVIAKDYRRLLELCTKAKKGCFLESKENADTLFFYLGRESVLCQPSFTQKNVFLFSIVKWENVPQHLLEIGFFPRYRVKNTKEYSQDLFYPILERQSQELFGKGEIEKIGTLIDLEKEQKTVRFAMSREEGEEYLIWEGENKKGKRFFNEENLIALWKELMEDGVFGGGSTYAWSGI